jgi:cellulose synthase/poly-beta-1,6-N-acetylglucosamine synthase-like glycosyltransferase
MSNLLQIVILSRDRPNFLSKTIESATNLNASDISYEIIISDNSESDDVNNLFKENYSKSHKISYRRRIPTVSSSSHYQLVIEELNSEYAVIFHDDDIFHPDYLMKISPILLNQSFSAIGCNALIFKKEIKDGFKKMHEFSQIKKFNRKKDFIRQYLVGNGGVAAFPGYIYKTEYLKKISFLDLPSGKHADVALLASLIKYGDIIWLADTLIYYRTHITNDSASESIVDRLSLLRYMFSNGISRSSKSVFLFRYFYWFNWLRQKGLSTKDIFEWRYRKSLKFLFFGAPRFLFSSYFMKIILKRIKLKR